MHTVSFRLLTVCVSVAVTLVTVCTVAHTARAASSQVSFFEAQIVAETDESGEVIDEHIDVQFISSVEAGGSLALDLTETYAVNVESDVLPFAYLPKGELYFIPDATRGDREFVSAIGGDEIALFMLPSAGTYEADIYGFYNPPPQQVQKSPLRNFFAELFGVPAAHAQTSDEHPDIFVETVRFEITDANAAAACCSNVLFIPGIKGSILAKDDLVGDDVLWPPTIWSNDVSQLALTETGESVHNIFVGGVLETFSNVPVYGPFVSFMDRVVAQDTINEWHSLPYDWRFSPEEILEDGIQHEHEVVQVIQEVEDLAENSDTKQVTIVAHSMGGLMGKAIIKKLEEEGKADLIDAFVMVGSPQLGTPQTITSLLHGHGEGIPNDFEGYKSILNNSIADPAASRVVARNVQSSHDLLPSPGYFNTVNDPVILFDEDAAYTDTWRQAWGNSIDTYTELEAFLTAQDAPRSDPPPGDLHAPEILRSELVENSENFHTEYDNYTIPEHIRVVQVAGWGRPTVKAVEYVVEHGEPNYRPIFTREGDRTVVYPSAISSLGEDYYFDIFDYNEAFDAEADHKDLLSIPQIQTVVASVIEEKSIGSIDYIYDAKPSLSNTEDQLLVSSHSPVVLGAYDETGNFTGIDQNSGEAVEDISGSTFRIFGTSQYIFLPKEGTYTFVYEGTGIGSTTVEVASFIADEITPIVRYTNMQTTEDTSATFEVDASEPENTVIKLDQNNDGMPDEEILPDGTEPQELSLEELVTLLRAKVEVLNLKRRFERAMVVKIKLLERAVEARIPFLRKLLGNINVRALEFDVRVLDRRGQITDAQVENLLAILAKIKEKI